MNILFFNSGIPNYVSDGLFHGLCSIAGITVVDIPRLDTMYKSASEKDLIKTGTKGSTLYQLLPENLEAEGKRTLWQADLEHYDLIIFTDIMHQCDLFNFIYKTIHPKKRKILCIVDGYDTAAMFPFINNITNLKVRPWTYLYNTRNVKYFKREFKNTGELFGIIEEKHKWLNKFLSKVISIPRLIVPISMSIPEEQIEYIPLVDKHNRFVNYNVDLELQDLFPNHQVAELGKWQPAFTNKEEYYNDIRKSQFGITTKRGGWDCLRHYEYAAKGVILCFKHLDKKSEKCAPFGLNNHNCIPYSSKQDLINKIDKKSIDELGLLQENQYNWIKSKTTKKVAMLFLDEISEMKSAKKASVSMRIKS